MSRQNIRKFSLGYALVHIIAGFYHKLYYRRYKMINLKKVPKNRPVIFAINHQNALMDALAIVFATTRQPVFMARADIFRKKNVARLLYFLKILPAYRIRDGFHSVDQNKEVFKEIIAVLEHNRPVGILPEGSHYGEKRLRPLQKGAGRFALMAEEANNFKLGIAIVPVGLDYSNYYHAGTDLLVIFGDPIPVADYRGQYIENPVQAVNQLKDDLAAAMKKVMIHIEPIEHYQTIKTAIDIYGPIGLKSQKLKNSPWNRFRIKKELSEKIAGNIHGKGLPLNDLKENLDVYNNDLKKFGIRDQQVGHPIAKPFSSFFFSCVTLLLLPIHLYGMLLNYLPYRLPIYLSRNIKDKHFLSSVRFGIGLLLFFFWYLLLIVASFFIFESIFISLAFIISLPITGIFAFYYYIHLLKMRGQLRWMLLRQKDRKAYEEFLTRRKEIIVKFEEILKI